jgi:hypothetical protein
LFSLKVFQCALTRIEARWITIGGKGNGDCANTWTWFSLALFFRGVYELRIEATGMFSTGNVLPRRTHSSTAHADNGSSWP